jgi:hemerythrin-like metal-binding protein
MSEKDLKDVVWSTKWAIGITSLDQEHKEIAQGLEVLKIAVEAPNSTEHAVELFISISALIASHFAREERIMENIGDPESAEHKKKHDHILQQLRRLQTLLSQKPNGENLAKTIDFLDAVVVHHVCEQDSKIREHLYR